MKSTPPTILGRSVLCASVLFLLCGPACGPSVVVSDSSFTCTYDGEKYAIGETFPAGCGSCECLENGEVGCGELECFPCEYEGHSYSHGDSFPANDGCNTCTCYNANVTCTHQGCATCMYGGQTYEPGEGFYAADGCNTCVCKTDGTVECTQQPCPQIECSFEGYTHSPGESWQSFNQCLSCSCQDGGEVLCSDNGPCSSCFYAGVLHQSGESFPALDGCNTCACSDGGSVSCTEISCPCDPAKEWYRDYVGDAQSCGSIDFDCVPNLTPFYNECGCGCEQASWCPPGFDCSPPSNCDVDQIKELCPLSVIGL